MDDTNVRLNWVPVDFVTRVVVEICKRPESVGNVFNLVGDGMNYLLVIFINIFLFLSISFKVPISKTFFKL